MVKLVIFDKDGTLIDLRATWAEKMEARRELFLDRLLNQIGKKNREQMKEYFINEIDIIFNEVDKMRFTVRPIAENVERLKEYKRRGFKVGIITLDKADITRKQMKRIGIYDNIDIIIGSSTKPNSEDLIRAMKEMGATPETTLAFGDTYIDMEFARNAGVRGIRV